MIYEEYKSEIPPRTQECPPSFLGGNGGDWANPGKLESWNFKSSLISTFLIDLWREKNQRFFQEVKNILLASLEDIEEMEHFLASYGAKTIINLLRKKVKYISQDLFQPFLLIYEEKKIKDFSKKSRTSS